MQFMFTVPKDSIMEIDRLMPIRSLEGDGNDEIEIG
jgi:hypothetical protein